ncbi:MAG: hypothetical protein RL456_1759 [Pseudomonadota bacterium]|jgi:chemotaxis protein CheZ
MSAPNRTAEASPEVVRRIGEVTRMLHDGIRDLGVMPDLHAATHALPDARSRLHYVARKSTEAAERVLDAVDEARREQHRIDALMAAVRQGGDTAPQDLRELLEALHGAQGRIAAQLTEIMMAQDYHDLTGQIITKVVRLTDDIEHSLVRLLMQITPEQAAGCGSCAASPAAQEALHGPVVDPAGRSDVACSQSEVDDLLARMGF